MCRMQHRVSDLRMTKLNGANLRSSDMAKTIFGANLQVADLSGSNLQGANLEQADLQGANLRVLIWRSKSRGAI